MFCIGEVFNGDATYVSSFQLNSAANPPSGALDAVLNYPMYYGILQAFGLNNGCTSGMYCLSPFILPTANPALYPQPALLGTFIDNHDNSRFLNMSGATVTLYKNALAVVLLSRGIPIIYYGSEQGFSGGVIPNGVFAGYTGQREIMWPHYDTGAPLYAVITRLVAARKLFGIAGPALDQKECWKSTSLYAFSRGGTLIAVTNTMDAQATLSSSSNPFPANSRACDFMSDRTQNPNPCVQSESNGNFKLMLTNGNFALYVPARALNTQLSLSSAVYGAPRFCCRLFHLSSTKTSCHSCSFAFQMPRP
jgi:alpha-amylase